MANPRRIVSMTPVSWRLSASALLMAVPLSLVSTTGCRQSGAIVLVIDTDMAVPAELDRLEVTVTGPTRTNGPFLVSLTGATDPPFPRTLTLNDAGKASPVTVAVAAFRGSDPSVPPLVTTTVRTRFVDDDSRMLRVVLSAACLGVTCETGTQTCEAGKCVAVDRTANPLPDWPGTTPPRPRPLPGEEAFVYSAGWRSCAPWGGTLYCWGENDRRQLGNPSATEGPVDQRVPVLGLVPNPSLPSTRVGLGYKHSCICDADTGKVYCWGNNDFGQAGQPATTRILTTPVEVPGINGCKLIAAGNSHTCVVHGGNNAVSCWGRNHFGQTGQPASTMPVVSTPLAVANFTMISELKAGENFTCAVTVNGGGVLCWGENGLGQLGDGTQTSRNVPARVEISGANGEALKVTELALGRYFACAQTENATVHCWGENTESMVSVGPPSVNRPTPKGIDDALHISAGHQHACVLRTSRKVSCWGSNQFGQLGNGSKVLSPSPVDVLNLDQVTALSTGIVHTCARTLGGTYCWGQNLNGQLGAGALTEQTTRVQVIGL